VTDALRVSAGRPRRAGVEDDALDATVALIADQGYARTSIDAIARRAGVAKTTLYRRWESKGDLAVDALASALGEPPVGERGRSGLERAVGWLADRVRDPAVRLLLLGLVGEAGRDPDLRARLRARIREPFTSRLVAEWGRSPAAVDLAFDVVVGTLLHRVAMTGAVTRHDAATVTELATRLLFADG